jgi:large subunit ribosomal protein L20
MTKGRLYRVSKEADLHAGQYAYRGRKERKRDFRKLWIMRINASLNDYDLKYSRFISLLKKANVDLNRKMLSQIAVYDPEAFKAIIKKIKN